MIDLTQPNLTAAGQALMAKINAGSGTVPLEITRIVTSSASDADPLNAAALAEEQQTFTILNRTTTGARTTIAAYLNNYGNPNATPPVPALAQGYPLAQIGIYARDPDEGEILLRVQQFDTPNYVPAATERSWEYEPKFNFVTGNASAVTIQIDPSSRVTKQDIWDSVEISGTAPANPGVKTQYFVAGDAPEYEPAEPASGLFAGAKIVETHIIADPGSTTNSVYQAALPITVLEAIFNTKTGERLSEILAAVSGRNLLDNWDFRNPVNQRNITGTFSTVGAYFIDRWLLQSGTVTLTANGLKLNGTIVQRLENRAGNRVTGAVDMFEGQATVSYDDSAAPYATLSITSNGGTVARAKLEMGSVSTLANDAPQDYRAELAKCQRYQLVLPPYYARYLGRVEFSVTDGRLLDVFIPTPQTLRANPAVADTFNIGYMYLVTDDQGGRYEEAGAVNNLTASKTIVYPNGVYIYASSPAAVGAASSYTANITPHTQIILDANL